MMFSKYSKYSLVLFLFLFFVSGIRGQESLLDSVLRLKEEKGKVDVTMHGVDSVLITSYRISSDTYSSKQFLQGNVDTSQMYWVDQIKARYIGDTLRSIDSYYNENQKKVLHTYTTDYTYTNNSIKASNTIYIMGQEIKRALEFTLDFRWLYEGFSLKQIGGIELANDLTQKTGLMDSVFTSIEGSRIQFNEKSQCREYWETDQKLIRKECLTSEPNLIVITTMLHDTIVDSLRIDDYGNIIKRGNNQYEYTMDEKGNWTHAIIYGHPFYRKIYYKEP